MKLIKELNESLPSLGTEIVGSPEDFLADVAKHLNKVTKGTELNIKMHLRKPNLLAWKITK